MRRRTPLDAAGHGQRPPGTKSAVRLIGEATAQRNGRAQRSPSVQVPDPTACAVEARRQRALLRMIDPLLDAEGGSAVDASGDMAMETAAFDLLPMSQQLPPHPPLWALLRCEDRAGAQAQLSRFGGKRGSFRAVPAYKVLARERMRIASHAQQRQHGAARIHTMLRAYASAFNALCHSAYSAGIISEEDLTSGEPARIYSLLMDVFSLKAIRHHCRTMDDVAEQRSIKASTLHVHYAHCHMLSSLADVVSPTLAGADARAASGSGVHALLTAKAAAQRRDANRSTRTSNTLEAAVAACGNVPSGAALGALRAHAELVVVQFAARIVGLPAPFGASEQEATEAVLAVGLALGLGRGARLGDLQQLTAAALVPPPTLRGAAAAAVAAGSHAPTACCVDLAHLANGKVASGARSGFEPGASIVLSPALHSALVTLCQWLSPPAGRGSAAALAALPLMPDVRLMYLDRGQAPPSLAAPLRQHRVLLQEPTVAAAAEAWLAARLAAAPMRLVPDATARAALKVALCGGSRLWRVPELPLLHDASWRWLRRWALTAMAAAWAERQPYCGAHVAPLCADVRKAAAVIAAHAGTSAKELVGTYTIGPWPVRARGESPPVLLPPSAASGASSKRSSSSSSKRSSSSSSSSSSESDLAFEPPPMASSSSSSSSKRSSSRHSSSSSSSSSSRRSSSSSSSSSESDLAFEPPPMAMRRSRRRRGRGRGSSESEGSEDDTLLLRPSLSLSPLLRAAEGAPAQLPRFGGPRGSLRAVPMYKELALERLRPSEEEAAAAPWTENEQLEAAAEAADDAAANANEWRSSVACGTHTRFTFASDED